MTEFLLQISCSDVSEAFNFDFFLRDIENTLILLVLGQGKVCLVGVIDDFSTKNHSLNFFLNDST